MCELLEMFFPGQAQDPVHRTCLGKCEIWSDTASNVDSIHPFMENPESSEK